tara:strand:+ start:884 stop:2191 length:1308 start_codon:yes stop_codon:yes gene_type:complete
MIVEDQQMDNFVNSYEFEKDYYIENRHYGSYIAFNGSHEFFDTIISFLKNPSSYLGFINSENYKYDLERDEILKENYYKGNLFLETSGKSYKKASNGIQYNWYIRFEKQDVEILNNAIKIFFDHAKIMQNFWERKIFPNFKDEDLAPSFNLEWEDVDAQLLDEFCIFLSSKLKDKKKYNIFSNKELNKIFLSLVDSPEEILYESLRPELSEIHNQIDLLNKKLMNQGENKNESDLKESIKKRKEKIEILESQLIKAEEKINSKNFYINTLENDIARIKANNNKIQKDQNEVFKKLYPNLKYLNENKFFSLFNNSNVDIFLNSMSEPLNIALYSPHEEVITKLEKKAGVKKVDGTKTWYKIPSIIITTHAEGMTQDSRTDWKGGVTRGSKTLEEFIFLSYATLRGNKSIYIHYDQENESSLEKLQMNDPPDLRSEF